MNTYYIDTKRIWRGLAVAMIAVPLVACQGMQNNPKQVVGTLIGTGLGALVGSQVGGGTGKLAAVAIGALAGAWAGREIGTSLDRTDKMHAKRTAIDSLEYNQIGQEKSWKNPDSGNSGTFTPTHTYKTESGQDCRKFKTTLYIDGNQEPGTGRACRQADGTWLSSSLTTKVR